MEEKEAVELTEKAPPPNGKDPAHHGIYNDGQFYYFSTPKLLREAQKKWGENSPQVKALEKLLAELVQERIG